MIVIRKPLCFSEIGRKDNQEDYLFPQEATEKTRVFILCDGMGGHDNGEVASRTAAENLGRFLAARPEVDTSIFTAALAKAYDALDAIDTGSDRKPGTTMTCLCLNSDSYLVAHIGDSRIYHLRPSLYDPATGHGGIIFQTSDHSLVNDLLKAGELTEEEARDFPQKNVITRAMQPHLPKRYKADAYVFNDVKGGDYFFLCCDGILEQLSNEDLCRILSDDTLSDDQKLAAIKAICDGKTKDNYTCWLIPIDKAEIGGSAKSSQVIQADVEASKKEESESGTAKPERNVVAPPSNLPASQKSLLKKFNIPDIPVKKYLLWIALIIVALCAIYGGYCLFNNFIGSRGEAEPTATEKFVSLRGGYMSMAMTEAPGD